MSKIIIILFLLLCTPVFAHAASYPEVSCSQYWSNANSCDQCFNGGSKYVGDTFTPDDYFHAGNQTRVYWQDENWPRYTVNTLNNNTNWYVSNDLIWYPPNFSWYTAQNGGNAWRKYHLFSANSSSRIYATKIWKWIRLQSVNGDNVSPHLPALKFTFVINYHDYLWSGQQWGKKTHKECVFYKPNYCWDGILQTNKGETCDPEDAAKTGWGNGGCDTNTCQPIQNPICKSLTVNKTIGEAPSDVVTTCTGYKVNTFKIDCGNGQTFTGAGNNSGNQTFQRTCNYQSAGSFIPTCFINNTITANSCRKTVNITASKVPSIIVDKRDANVFDLDGNVGNDTQSVYQGESARFKIRVTNNGEEALKNINLIDTVWDWCASNGYVDLKWKKFINKKGKTKTIAYGWVGNHKDNLLNIWEWFEYYCAKWDTQSNYTNTVLVNSTGNISGKWVSGTDPTVVIVIALPNPEISVDKRDDNPADLDGNIGGNDSQTVGLTNKAAFRITVENTGNEDLIDIFLNDPMALACSSTGNVDLQNKTFRNSESYDVNITVSGAWNHNDNILQVWEIFTYTCAKYNTQESYTNIVDVSGVGIISGDSDTDTDPTEVIILTDPNIQIIKEDANSNDIDGIQFNDTQTVLTWEEAIFHITVKNTGNENLKDIILTDIESPSCGSNGTTVNLVNSYFTNSSGVQVVINYLVSSPGNHSDNILQVGEEFSYTCSAPNTQANYTNIVEVGWIGVFTETSVWDEDPSVVIVKDGIYDLALRKTLSNTTPGPFSSWSIVTFDIEIVNQGDIDAKASIIDYIPEGLTLADADWTENNGIAYYKENPIRIDSLSNDPLCVLLGICSEWIVQITFTVDADAPSVINNYAEIASDDGDDCDSIPDDENGNDDLVNDRINSGCDDENDEDDHDIETITIGNTPSDVVLTKELAPGQAAIVEPGDTINYIITVKNNGSEVATNLIVEDSFPVELTLADSDWTLDATRTRVAVYNTQIASLAPWAEQEIEISFTVNAGAKGTIINLAIVCDTDEVDGECDEPEVCDPETDDCCDEDDENGDVDGCEPIFIPSITIDKLDANPELDQDNNVWNDSQKVNNGQKAVFSIRVTNDGPLSLDTIVLTDARAPNCAGSVTLPNTISSWISFTTGGVGDKSDSILEPGEWFEYTCEKDNTQNDYTNTAWVTGEAVGTDIQVNDSDTSNVVIDTDGTSGSTHKCTWESQTWSIVTCKWNSKADSFYLKCGSTILNPVNTTIVSGQHQAIFTCASEAYQCYIDNDSVPAWVTKDSSWFTQQSWRTSSACKQQSTTSSNHCGNGILEENRGEQCDFGSSKNGLGTNACDTNCKIKTVTSNCADTNTCVLTWPNGGDMIFGLSTKSIIGHTQNPLEWMGSISLTNNSDYDMAYDNFCVKRTASDEKGWVKALKSGNASGEYCTPNISNDVIYAYETITLADYAVYPNYRWNKDWVSGTNFGDATLTASVKSNGVEYYNAYFAQKADIRIAKPAVVTIGWWTSYVKSNTTADVAKITNNSVGNTNFVWVSVGSWSVSSAVEVVVIGSDAQWSISNETAAVENNSLDTSTATTTLEKFNGLDNVFIIKWTNLETSSLSWLNSLTEGRTYIIEDADLIINSDISSNKNIAFVVKNGDIVVISNVTEIAGTYVVLGTWEIKGQASAHQLLVNGSLYGNIDNLVANRYYISDDSSGQLSVGTIVSFGSSLFSRPAPLVSQFVGEYLESTKVAR
jgi:uncharacterized repeat protein (TIGR01451 family)